MTVRNKPSKFILRGKSNNLVSGLLSHETGGINVFLEKCTFLMDSIPPESHLPTIRSPPITNTKATVLYDLFICVPN